MTNTIKCVILDDELLALSYLKLICEQIEDVEVVKAFNRPDLFLKEIDSLDCDVCILDIEMPEISGLEVAKSIQNQHIIFTTAYKEYAADAYDLNVVDYVRKPLKKERLQQAFDKIKQIENSPRKTFVELNTSLGKIQIEATSILYIRISDIDSRDKIALLDDGSEIILKNINFKTLLSTFPEGRWVQINKKEVIAIPIVKAFSGSEIISNLMNDSQQNLRFQVTEVFREDFLKLFKN